MINSSFIQENFPKGKLSVVLGRPAAGKTSMAVSLAQVLVSDGNHPIFFSMEMSKEMLVTRFAAHMGVGGACRCLGKHPCQRYSLAQGE